MVHDGSMIIRFASLTALLGVALVMTTPGSAAPVRKPAPPRPPAPMALPDTVRVTITTTLGAITLDLDHRHAPITVENFVAYADQKRLDGTVFYRVMRLPWGDGPNGLIQGGARGDPRRILKPIAHEPTTQTGILHTAGTISMARYAPGTATGDFSILVSDQPGFNADPNASGDKDGYAAFGHVVDGMDVVMKIYATPLSPTLGEGFLKGQMIAAPIKIISVRRIPMPATPAAPTPAPPTQGHAQ